MNLIICFTLLITLCAVGCDRAPVPVAPPVRGDAANGLLVVNEGVWGQDNGTLTYYNPAGSNTVNDYFALQNPGLRLGDVPNSITIANGRAYIAVTGSRSLEVVRLPECKSIGRVRMYGPSQPRDVAIVDSTLGCITVLSDSVILFDPISLQVIAGVPVGPAPDGVAVAAGRLFVANSGYGLFRQHEPKAGTISVIDIDSRSEIALIPIGANPRPVSRLGDRIYVAYGLADSTGGIVEIDPVAMRETHRWVVPNVIDMAIDISRGRLIIVADNRIMAIDPLHPSELPITLLAISDYPGSLFYAVGVAPETGEIFVAKTEGYLPQPARVLRLDAEGRFIMEFECGVYPGDFGFY